MFAVLGCCMAQATPIPSAYYSAVGAGSFYLYDITAETFLSHSNNYPATASTPDASCLMVVSSNGDGTYAIKYNNAQYLKMGTYNNIYIWADGGSSDTKWIFTTVAGAVNTYIVSTSEYADQFSTKTWYLISGNATDVEANAHQYALITAANYAEYVARQAAEAAFSKAVSQANTIRPRNSGGNFRRSRLCGADGCGQCCGCSCCEHAGGCCVGCCQDIHRCCEHQQRPAS